MVATPFRNLPHCGDDRLHLATQWLDLVSLDDCSSFHLFLTLESIEDLRLKLNYNQ